MRPATMPCVKVCPAVPSPRGVAPPCWSCARIKNTSPGDRCTDALLCESKHLLDLSHTRGDALGDPGSTIDGKHDFKAAASAPACSAALHGSIA